MCHGVMKRQVQSTIQCPALSQIIGFCPIRKAEESRRQKKNSDKNCCWEEEFRGTAEETQAYDKEEKGEKDESKIPCE